MRKHAAFLTFKVGSKKNRADIQRMFVEQLLKIDMNHTFYNFEFGNAVEKE